MERHPNYGLAAYASRCALFLFTFVVVENTAALRSSNYTFLRGCINAARPGAIFLFTDTDDRLWPEIASVAFECGGSGASCFVLAFSGTSPKHALVVAKGGTGLEAQLADLVSSGELAATRNSAGERCFPIHRGALARIGFAGPPAARASSTGSLASGNTAHAAGALEQAADSRLLEAKRRLAAYERRLGLGI